MTRRRLLLVSRRFWPLVGGAETFMAQLAAQLAAQGNSVQVVTARWSPEWPADLAHRGVPVHRLRQSPRRVWGTWQYLRGLERCLGRTTPPYDLAYVSMLKHDAWAVLRAARRQGLPVVLRAEGAGPSGDVHWQLEARCGRRIKSECLRAAALVAPSRAIEQELIAAGYPRERIHYLPNGVPLGPSRSAATRLQARQALAEAHPALRLSADDPLAVFTGRLHEGKGLADLVAGWPAIDAHWPRARLWLVGDGPQAADLTSQIEALGLSGRVVLAGSFDQVDEILAAADLFVLPSREEGMSIALLEAMAAALPVVACDIPGNRPLIEPERQGLLVPVGQPAALALAIQRLWKEPAWATALGAAARQRVADEFSLARSAQRHQELFDRLCGDPRHP